MKLNIHSSGINLTLILLLLTQIPIAIKTAAEIACIGQSSNKHWKETNNHSLSNVIAVNYCNGGT